jgi:hypothetical protein
MFRCFANARTRVYASIGISGTASRPPNPLLRYFEERKVQRLLQFFATLFIEKRNYAIADCRAKIPNNFIIIFRTLKAPLAYLPWNS